MKICFHYTILSFRLPVYLKVECGGELSLDIDEVTKQGPDLGCENRSSITDDRVRDAVMSYYHVDDYFRQFWSIYYDFDWLIMHHLS